MKHTEKILTEMERLLDKLITNAEKLHEISQQVVAEEELGKLQQTQEELLSQLIKLDDAFHKASQEDTKGESSPIRTRIQEKLDIFQQLNSNFINNIMSSQGLIRFEGHKIKKHKK